ncbi:bestrophin-4-like isoform X1 [Diorhabda sublineata]|uniref:bestrophin-4-like isoform X1 n=2 Tax=Diorhabda sublineata TaxID=1163346 RepID=UPI0024E05719|nr:bestrophin-4-like isoform X1 [Diorhabda sublineata]
MTVTYNADVATVHGLGPFLKLLGRWRGSLYKLVWLDLVLFLVIYYGLNIIYRFLLDDQGKVIFENIVRYCDDYANLIPLSFVLGFYVTVVMNRWWSQYRAIPHPDPVAVFVSATVHGHDERGRVMRRTIMRYMCLCVTMVFTMISPRVKKRFPTLDHFVDAGLLQPSEKDIMSDLDKKFPKYSKHWLPLVWASSIVTRARKEGRIRDDFAVKTIIDEMNKFRGQCGLLLTYDHINIPLVYTQVVTLAVYSYFITNVMAHQWTTHNKYNFDLFFPIFTTLQFFFYIGWLKVAESMINPFGDDDDDFEVNWMVDRNLQVAYLIVDEIHHDHPELVKDQYWDEVFPQELPYTEAARAIRDTHPLPSTANIATRPQDFETNQYGSNKMYDMQSYVTGLDGGPITFSAKPRPNSFRSKGSQNSLIGKSVPDSISRHNSVTNMLKRFFSRDESKNDAKVEGNEMNNLMSQSSYPKHAGSVKKIADDVIEEVDEQQTINSQRSFKEPRPTVMSLFGPPSPSSPIDVPHSNSFNNLDSNIFDPFGPISRSIPGMSHDGNDGVSIGGSVTDDDDDEFSRLKKLREEERISRMKETISRSFGKADDVDVVLSRQSSSQATSTTPTPTCKTPVMPNI